MSRIRSYVELGGKTIAAGDTHFNFRRGRLTSTFSYDRGYVALPGAYAVDPALRLTTGSWPLPQGLPGAFSDAAPDRWGRNLIAKRLRAEASAESRAVPTLDDRDYLLGVSDETRQGALRFKTDAGDEFQHPAPDVPKLIALPSLLYAANAVARDEPDNLDAIKTLLDAGTGSLGGARPKASVRDDRGSGWRLAPAFDVNPNPELAAQRVTSVGGATRPADEVNALLVYAESFGLTDSQAHAILREVAEAADNWDPIARRNGISQAERARFEPTLSHTINAVRPH
ncbi:HipA N-terminal domain-containing protein [Winogradskya humida]|uniref:HipA N-terminal subdomain 1 domain-containing protein n=1 Tax=Winogradskya humida TaxID=113566 RepID=A0ABQ3ZWE0_9ACTN|nr:HipA N-terminal domain-containing protein [Actinoplanes humidus]GIE22842.1 hypothetical protein Ahu01nite_059440 [Actinoplanes humidus]